LLHERIDRKAEQQDSIYAEVTQMVEPALPQTGMPRILQRRKGWHDF
jgi:hypothetical protein